MEEDRRLMTQEKLRNTRKQKKKKNLLQLCDVIQEGMDCKPTVEKIRFDNNEDEEPQDNEPVKKLN